MKLQNSLSKKTLTINLNTFLALLKFGYITTMIIYDVIVFVLSLNNRVNLKVALLKQ